MQLVLTGRNKGLVAHQIRPHYTQCSSSTSPWSLRHLPLQGCSQVIIILIVFLISTLNVFKSYPYALLHCSFASAVDVRQHTPPHRLASQTTTVPSFNFPDLDLKPRSQPPPLLLYCHPSSSLHLQINFS